jgi:hypothetical protein
MLPRAGTAGVIMGIFALCLEFCLISPLAAFGYQELSVGSGERSRKLIATGWDNPSTSDLRLNLGSMEQRPFDGVIVEALGRKDPKTKLPLKELHVNAEWQRQWFSNCVEDLRACSFRKFTDNFLLVGANPGNVDWFDDAGWANITAHWQIAAWIARKGGIKGLAFDPEAYNPPFNQFSYASQPQSMKYTYTQYNLKAKQRGSQVMSAIAGEYEDMTFFFFFMNSILSHIARLPDNSRLLQYEAYGLLPAFIDGMLSAAPSKLMMIDGCEAAYRFNNIEEYFEAAIIVKNECQNLISPENRSKYRAQVRLGFGFYLDSYSNPQSSPWHIDPKGGTSLDRLKENLTTAMRVSDQLIWIYGEKYRWWQTGDKRVTEKFWPEVFPGIEKILSMVRVPDIYAMELIRRAAGPDASRDLIANGNFAAGKRNSPANWGLWQAETSKGTLEWDAEVGNSGSGSGRAVGVKEGSFTQAVLVKPGKSYAVSALRKISGKGMGSVLLRWQDQGGGWIQRIADQAFDAGMQDGWNLISGVITAPLGVTKMVVLLRVNGQSSTTDIVWFDDVHVYALDP